MVGQLELARLLAGGAGEGAALVAEQLRLQELAGQGSAVDLDERLAAPRGPIVQRARDAFLPDAALAADEDRHVGLGDAIDHVPDAQHRRARGDEVGRHAAPRSIRRNARRAQHGRRLRRTGRRDDRRRLRLIARREAQGHAAALDGFLQLLRLDRLDEIVAGAEAHRLDHRFLLVHRRERDDRRRAAFRAVAAQHLEAVQPRHPQIQEHRLGRRRGSRQPLQSRPAVLGRESVEADPPEKLDEDFARRLVVVDHHHLVWSLQHQCPHPETTGKWSTPASQCFRTRPASGSLRADEQALCQQCGREWTIRARGSTACEARRSPGAALRDSRRGRRRE